MPPSERNQQATSQLQLARRQMTDPSMDECAGLAVAVHHDATLPALVVEVTGELDTLTAPRLMNVLRATLREPCSVVVVDLTGVEFMGSAGLAVLAEAHDRAGTSISLRIVASALVTLRPLQITGLDAVFDLYRSRPDALIPSR